MRPFAKSVWAAALAVTFCSSSARAQSSSDITPEQQQKWNTASHAASLEPEVRQARKVYKDAWDEYRAIVREKILTNDPGMKPILAKGDLSDPGKLTQDEIDTLQAALQKVGSDPAITDAVKKLRAARKALAEITGAAILKADPSLAPFVDGMKKHAEIRQD